MRRSNRCCSCSRGRRARRVPPTRTGRGGGTTGGGDGGGAPRMTPPLLPRRRQRWGIASQPTAAPCSHDLFKSSSMLAVISVVVLSGIIKGCSFWPILTPLAYASSGIPRAPHAGVDISVQPSEIWRRCQTSRRPHRDPTPQTTQKKVPEIRPFENYFDQDLADLSTYCPPRGPALHR